MLKKILDKIKIKIKKWLDCDCDKNKGTSAAELSSGEYVIKNNSINILDPNLFSDYIKTSEGRRYLINTVSKNKDLFKDNLGV